MSCFRSLCLLYSKDRFGVNKTRCATRHPSVPRMRAAAAAAGWEWRFPAWETAHGSRPDRGNTSTRMAKLQVASTTTVVSHLRRALRSTAAAWPPGECTRGGKNPSRLLHYTSPPVAWQEPNWAGLFGSCQGVLDRIPLRNQLRNQGRRHGVTTLGLRSQNQRDLVRHQHHSRVTTKTRKDKKAKSGENRKALIPNRRTETSNRFVLSFLRVFVVSLVWGSDRSVVDQNQEK